MFAFQSSLLVLFLLCSGTHAEYRLRHLDTEYLPKSYLPAEVFEYDAGAAEQMAVDHNQAIAYVSGRNFIHVVDISNPESLSRPYYLEVGPAGSGEGTDVETCGNLVAVSYDNFVDPLDGKVFIYSTYDASAATPMTLLYNFTVGSLPDMVKFTHDCSHLVVAVEGEVRMVDGAVVDPEGLVAVITFHPDPISPTLDIADFTRFNNGEEILIDAGVRRSYSGQGTNASTTLSQDLEPEYIAINDQTLTAYVILQENNAVAVVDIQSAYVVALYGLGYDYLANTKIDASDMDGGINRNFWPIYSIPQPDGAVYVEFGGGSYLITANEGDAKEYEMDKGFPFDWTDAQTGSDFAASDFAPGVSAAFINDLADVTKLGRLEFSTVNGLHFNYTNLYTDLYSFGGRSFSIYNTSDWTRVYNSGDDFEKKIARKFPSIFNTNPSSELNTPEQMFDTRSDNKGPEPESVAYGVTTCGDHLVFIGCERPGFVFLYTMGMRNGALDLDYQSLHYGGGLGNTSTWTQLYNDRAVRDLDPEDLKFIPASYGIANYDILAVSGAYSGTISLYEVYNDDDGCDGSSSEDSDDYDDDDFYD